MEVAYRDYANKQLARAILADERIAHFIAEYRKMDEASHTLNDWVASQLSEHASFDTQMVARRLAALDDAHRREMHLFVNQHFPERVTAQASLETRVFTRFLYDRDFRGRDVLFARETPDFLRGHDLTLDETLTVYLWAAYDPAKTSGEGVREAPLREDLFVPVLLGAKSRDEPSMAQRIDFLRRFHAYIHYRMETSAEYRSASGRSVLRLSYKPGGGGLVHVTTCAERTSECNTTFAVTNAALKKLTAMIPRLEPAETSLALGCANHACQREPRYANRTHFFCSPLCAYLYSAQ